MNKFLTLITCALFSTYALSAPTNIIVKFNENADDDLKTVIYSYIDLEEKHKNIIVVKDDNKTMCIGIRNLEVLNRIPKVIRKISEATKEEKMVISGLSHGCP